MMLKTVKTSNAPLAVGPYSQAIIGQGQRLIFISGQIPLDPATMKTVDGGIEEQARSALTNLGAVLAAAGVSLDRVAKTTVYLKNMDDFSAVNAEYEKFFSPHRPARACIEVSRLPKDVLVEIDAIAID